MKGLFTVQVRKADGAFQQENILAADAVGKVAIVAAIESALAAAGAGAMFQSASLLGRVDTDATGA